MVHPFLRLTASAGNIRRKVVCLSRLDTNAGRTCKRRCPTSAVNPATKAENIMERPGTPDRPDRADRSDETNAVQAMLAPVRNRRAGIRDYRVALA